MELLIWKYRVEDAKALKNNQSRKLVGAILINCHTCLYGSTTTTFGAQPPLAVTYLLNCVKFYVYCYIVLGTCTFSLSTSLYL